MTKKSEIAIRVSNVSKSFKLPHEKHTSVKGALIGLFNSNRSYEKQEVLNNISFEIKKGDFFGIVGRNGSGKSTLLKLLAGIYTPDQGSINISGELTPFIELGVGFNPELTGSENIYLNGALLGFSRKEVESMYDEIVEFAELEKFMDQKLKNYSSGMQVRLAFSIAIRANTDILVLDEVLAVGDSNFQKKCFDYFGRIKNAKKTVILVTHDMSAVERFCNKAILINNGDLVAEGNPAKITQIYSDINADNQSAEIKKKARVRNVASSNLIKVETTLEVSGKETALVRDQDKKFVLKYDVTSNEDIENVVFGTIIFNGAGTPIFATNTKINKTKLNLQKAKTKHIEIELDNIFANGEYNVAVNVKSYQQTEIYFTSMEVLKFVSAGRKHDFALVNPGFDISIKN